MELGTTLSTVDMKKLQSSVQIEKWTLSGSISVVTYFEEFLEILLICLISFMHIKSGWKLVM